MRQLGPAERDPKADQPLHALAIQAGMSALADDSGQNGTRPGGREALWRGLARASRRWAISAQCAERFPISTADGKRNLMPQRAGLESPLALVLGESASGSRTTKSA